MFEICQRQYKENRMKKIFLIAMFVFSLFILSSCEDEEHRRHDWWKGDRDRFEDRGFEERHEEERMGVEHGEGHEEHHQEGGHEGRH
jgi:hypothetical protein